MRVVEQAVQQRRGQSHVLRERCVSLPERRVAGHDQAAALVQRSDRPEEQLGLLPAHLNLTSVETPAFRPERREFPGLKAGVSRSGLGGDSNPFQALFGSSGLKA